MSALALSLAACTPCVEVVVYADTPERVAQLEDSVRRAEDFFDGVVVFETRGEVVDALPSHDGHPGLLLPHTRTDVLPVYLMEDIQAPDWGDAIGVAYQEECSAAVGIRVGNQANAQLMAHELGHVFGLAHEPERHNVMSINAFSGSSFDEWQVEFMEHNAHADRLDCDWIR